MTCSIHHLPEEVFFHLLSQFVSPERFPVISRLSKRFHRLANDDLLFKVYCCRPSITPTIRKSDLTTPTLFNNPVASYSFLFQTIHPTFRLLAIPSSPPPSDSQEFPNSMMTKWLTNKSTKTILDFTQSGQFQKLFQDLGTLAQAMENPPTIVESASRASSTDHPSQSPGNVLSRNDFWSSRGTESSADVEWIDFQLNKPAALIKSFTITPFRATFQR